MLRGKKVLLGVTASIAAYKTAELVRLFKKEGASVRVIQTEASLDFITPLTLATLSDNPVLVKMVDADSGEWSNHVNLGLWADMMVIAPLSANSMAKMKSGECDNLLLATYLSAKCPVFFAPAMDLDMFKHPSTKLNISSLQEYGNILIPSGIGELASGLVGEGRMAEPSEIIDSIIEELNKNLPLTNKRVLVTAGPTHESIDPVRFIANRSSGKMGIALAIEAANNGATVSLILGPTHLECNHPNVSVYRVTTCSQMHKLVNSYFSETDIGIFAAAVSDYKPDFVSENKIKKSSNNLNLSLKKTVDILLEMGNKKNNKQFIVGFALETNNEIDNAMLKLKRKNLDMIVLNSLKNKGAGFQYNTNKISIIDKVNNINNYDLKDKSEVAKDIIDKIIELNE